MKKRTKIRLLTFFGAFLAGICGFWLDTRMALDVGRTELEYVYRRSLNDLTDYVSGMRSTLKKAAYVSTAPLQSSVAAELLEQSSGAKAAMGALPFSQEKSERVSRFLSQAGDYALALSRKALRGEKLEEQDFRGLASLESYAGKLEEALTEIQAGLTAERSSIGTTESPLRNVSGMESLPLLDDGLDEVAQEFSEFPSLLYDGPFSDHTQRREALFLKGKQEVSQQEAAQKAAEFLECSPEDLVCPGEGGKGMTVYSFVTEDSRVNVTKTGGEIAYFKKSGAIAETRLSYEQALEKAKSFLRELGILSVRESYYVTNDNMCTINFASLEQAGTQEAVCYPDLIKVTVELNQGGTVEYDAAGYLMNHHERKLPFPALSQKEAEKNISSRLTAEKAALAVIPTPGQDEVLCWEFLCTAADGAQILTYLNAETGLEEQLYLLQKDDHGILVI